MSQLPRSKRPSPAVYRRRRIATFIVLLVLVGLVWSGVNAISGWFGGSSSSTDFELPEGMSESSVVVESGQPCPPGTIEVVALVGSSSGETQNSFASNETPYVWFSLTNTNPVDCTFNAGGKAQFFTIQSGEEDIWKSAQCVRDDLVDSDISLQFGETIESKPSAWEKVFSSDSGCGVEQPPVTTEGSSYHLKVQVNGELSVNSQQFVLN